MTLLPLDPAGATELDSARIQLGLRKLGVVGSVLYVGAHPDDENTNLLAYLSNQALLRTAYLSLTRGDGGQNLIGAEQGAELGVIRTQELLAARRVDGAEQFFTRARDFGYSKHPEETLRIWGKEAVLADVVWVIRRFRPDVVITRFSPEPSDTHGHHTASAQLALEAFRAAADPTRFPEQLREVQPWQAQRLIWNRSSWGIKSEDDLSGFIRLDVGTYNALLGLSYGEMAAESRSMHKSQGFGVARTRGPIFEYFKLLDGAPLAGSILGGLDFSWSRIKDSRAIVRLIERAQRAFVPAAPYKIVSTLLQLHRALDSVPDRSWRVHKQAQVRDLVLACAGLFVEATAGDFHVVPGGTMEVTATAINRSPVKFTLREIRFPGPATGAATAKNDAPLVSLEARRTITVPADTGLSTPYWLVAPPGPGLFHVENPTLIHLPETPAPLAVEFVLASGDSTLTVTRPVVFKWTDPVDGERYRPLEITPPILLRPTTTVLVSPNGEPRSLAVRLSAVAAPLAGTLRPEIPTGWSVSPASVPFVLAAKGDEREILFQIQPATAEKKNSEAVLPFFAEIGATRFTLGQTRIEHAHIPIQTILSKAEVHLSAFPLERRGTRIGYLPGPGDEVPASLRQAGYTVTIVDDKALAEAAARGNGFAGFDAVVVGVRAFNSSAPVRAAHAALLAYVQSGGTLVVQYNTNNRLSPLTAPIGPFPFEIGRERVTDENAPVTFLSPVHAMLKAPNLLNQRDFDGWVQERGLYFAANWDPRYQTVLAMADPGERALPGGILVTPYGKGTFVYTGLAFFRQLPAGVPGAFRLFANLLAGGSHGQ